MRIFMIQLDTVEIKIINAKNRLHEITYYKWAYSQYVELSTHIKLQDITYDNLESISRLLFLYRWNRLMCQQGFYSFV
jgi:hypothetical protein